MKLSKNSRNAIVEEFGYAIEKMKEAEDRKGNYTASQLPMALLTESLIWNFPLS